MNFDNATNQGAGDLSSDTGVADLDNSGGGNTNLDNEGAEGDLGDGQDDEATEIELEEVEHEGAKYQIPKALKPALLMQADYTRKTQELANERRTWDADRTQQAERLTQLQQLSEASLEARATAKALDAQLAQFAKVDWSTWMQSDPAAAQAARWQMEQLRDAKTGVDQEIKDADAKTLEAQQQDAAKRLQDGHAVLARDIPGWNADMAGKLAAFGQEQLGFTREELSQVADPRLIKLLHLAMTNAAQAKTQQQVQRQAQGQKTQPAQQVRGKSGQFAVAADTSDFAAFEKLADQKLAKK